MISGIILGMGSVNGRRRYIVRESSIGWGHAHKNPCIPESRFVSGNKTGCYKEMNALTLWHMATIDWLMVQLHIDIISDKVYEIRMIS